MSCGISKDLLKLADEISAVNQELKNFGDELLGTVGDALKIQELQEHYDKIKTAYDAFKNGNFLDAVTNYLPDNLQDDIGTAIALYNQGKNFLDELNKVKSKWEGFDGEGIGSLEDIANSIRSLSTDLDNLCQKIPNIERAKSESGEITFIVRGSPLSLPDFDPVAIIKGKGLPTFNKEAIGYDVVVRQRQAGNSLVNVDIDIGI